MTSILLQSFDFGSIEIPSISLVVCQRDLGYYSSTTTLLTALKDETQGCNIFSSRVDNLVLSQQQILNGNIHTRIEINTMNDMIMMLDPTVHQVMVINDTITDVITQDLIQVKEENCFARAKESGAIIIVETELTVGLCDSLASQVDYIFLPPNMQADKLSYLFSKVFDTPDSQRRASLLYYTNTSSGKIIVVDLTHKNRKIQNSDICYYTIQDRIRVSKKLIKDPLIAQLYKENIILRTENNSQAESLALIHTKLQHLTLTYDSQGTTKID